MTKFCKKSLLRGQSLFEVVVALALISVVLTSVVALAVTSIKNASFSKNNAQANRYAQETIEWLRIERDRNWTNFANRSVGGNGRVWCLPSLSWPDSDGSCAANQVIPGTIFLREVRLVLGVNLINVAVTIRWNDSSGTRSVVNNTILTNWRR